MKPCDDLETQVLRSRMAAVLPGALQLLGEERHSSLQFCSNIFQQDSLKCDDYYGRKKGQAESSWVECMVMCVFLLYFVQ